MLDNNGTVRNEIKTKRAKDFPIIEELKEVLKPRGDSPFVFSKKDGKQLYTKKILNEFGTEQTQKLLPSIKRSGLACIS